MTEISVLIKVIQSIQQETKEGKRQFSQETVSHNALDVVSR
jgi:hypothetical protein